MHKFSMISSAYSSISEIMTKSNDIQSLTELLIDFFWNDDATNSFIISEKLSAILGPPSEQSYKDYPEPWVLIYETRNQIEDAIRVAELEIMRRRSAILANEFDAYPRLKYEMVQYLQDGLYLQADRLNRNGESIKALCCLHEVYSLGSIYDSPPDDDVKELMKLLSASTLP